MIVFTDKTGQLGNQLFEFSTFIANARQHNSKLINFYFNDYGHFFQGYTQKDPLIVTRTGRATLDKILRNLLRAPFTLKLFTAFNRVLQGTGSAQDISTFNSTQKVFLKNGSWFTNFEQFYHHADFIKSYFSLLPEREKQISQHFNRIKKNYDVVIGLHIRRGDYATFLDGKYHYSDQIYAAKIREAIQVFPGKKVGELVCSNEIIDASHFPNIPLHKGLGHFIDDMYTLAKCDYILGPPSTYTMWASFYGSAPLYKIHEPEEPIRLEKFSMDYGY